MRQLFFKSRDVISRIDYTFIERHTNQLHNSLFN